MWRVITRILSAHAFDTAQGPEHALECGCVLGHFHYLVSDMPPESISDPLPGFHVTSGYLKHYDATLRTKRAQALLNASVEAKRLARYIEERRAFAHCLEQAEAAGELKRRMFHGDPKANTIMIADFTAANALTAYFRANPTLLGHRKIFSTLNDRGYSISFKAFLERYRDRPWYVARPFPGYVPDGDFLNCNYEQCGSLYRMKKKD